MSGACQPLDVQKEFQKQRPQDQPTALALGQKGVWTGKIDEVTFFIAPGLGIRGIQVCCAIYAPRG